MLKRLLIRNIVLVEEADISFASGLNVLTGETGAGKSILLDALGLVLGERSDASLVRAGAKQASVAAEFIVDARLDVTAFLLEIGIEPEDMLIIRRVVEASGKSRAFVNDVSVSVAALKQLAALLVEQHSQHDQRTLREPQHQRDAIDRFAGAEEAREECRTAYTHWKAARDAYDALMERAQQTERERAFLQHMVEEIGALAPVSGEESELSTARTAMQQQVKAQSALVETLTILQKPSDVLQQILTAQKLVARSIPESLEGKTALHDALERAWGDVSEAVDQLERWLENRPDAQALDRAEERLFALRDVARKYRITVDELHDALVQARMKLSELDTLELRAGDAAKSITLTRAAYVKASDVIAGLREKSLKRFMAAVAKELKPLKMDKAQVLYAQEVLSESQWNDAGCARVQLMASTNPGSPLAPLAEIASGGELSRMMLALKVVLNAKDTPSVYVFDEIDTGTGGAVAEAIGVRLKHLSAGGQVLVVTHAPQVAAQGERHLLITKQVEKGQTFTNIRVLSELERQDEVARMLSGSTVTDAARDAARQLMRASA
jgi:DNA repair protein RecN (Recombination protein N)